MKKYIIQAILIFCLTTTGLFAFDSGELNRITLVNNTGSDIWYLFLSPGDSDDWGFDILGSEYFFEDGGELSFYIHYPDYENEFDIMAIDEGGNPYVLYDELISDSGEARIILDDWDREENLGTLEFIEIYFTNETDYEMYYLFASPGDSIMWGVDMMDDGQTLMPGEDLNLLALYYEGSFRYDIMAVDGDGDEYSFYIEYDSGEVAPNDSLGYAIEYGDLVVD
ncbi:MAG: hypothetical protein PQJ59_08115 [Spirochaetales bacterium]|nr:hypothetical protein [Spirochaetales bacterium]